MKKYLIKDYSDCKDACDSPSIDLVLEEALFKILDQQTRAVVVYELGDCIIDWSGFEKESQ